MLEETAHEFRPTALLGVYLTRPPATPDMSAPGVSRRAWRQLAVWLTAAQGESATRHRSLLVLRCIEDFLSGIKHRPPVISTEASIWR